MALSYSIENHFPSTFKKYSCQIRRVVLQYPSAAYRCTHEKNNKGCLCNAYKLASGRKGMVIGMDTTGNYFVVKKKAVPDVLLKVVEAKRLLETGKAASIHEATEKMGISRSSFYKYKDDIFPFHDNSQGKTITLTLQMYDEPGLLSDVLKVIADFKANILTIHQSIPINGVASLSISVQVLPATGDMSRMLELLEKQQGVYNVKVLAKE